MAAESKADAEVAAAPKTAAEPKAKTKPLVPVPYVTGYGNITKALNSLAKAQTPPTFTQDFLSSVLKMSGGSARPVIPFLKKAGFLGSDGTPTDRYKRFRNEGSRGVAAAEGLRAAFAPLYKVNEYVHKLDDAKLTGLIVQVTGLEESSPAVGAIRGSFKALKAFANFDAVSADGDAHQSDEDKTEDGPGRRLDGLGDIRLGYTINLNLPPTSDVAVFNAIFKSLREHLLRDE